MLENSDLNSFKMFTKIKANKKINDNNITDSKEIRKIMKEAEEKAYELYNKECENDTSHIYIIRKLTEAEKLAIEYET